MRANTKMYSDSFPEHIIKYTDGISVKHVRASMSPHTVIDYPWLLDDNIIKTRNDTFGMVLTLAILH